MMMMMMMTKIDPTMMAIAAVSRVASFVILLNIHTNRCKETKTGRISDYTQERYTWATKNELLRPDANSGE